MRNVKSQILLLKCIVHLKQLYISKSENNQISKFILQYRKKRVIKKYIVSKVSVLISA